MKRWIGRLALLTLFWSGLIGVAVAIGHHMRGSGVVIFIQEWNEPGLVAVDLNRMQRQWFYRNVPNVGMTRFACSPDGRRIALFNPESRFLFHLFVLDLDTHRLTQVNVPDLQDSTPAWTPDSLHLVVSIGPDDQNIDLYLIDLTGESRQQLTSLEGVEYGSSVSSRGAVLFSYVLPDTPLVDLRVLDPETGLQTQLTMTEYSGARTARWSPDGTQIAFARKDDPLDTNSPYDMMVFSLEENRLRTLVDSSDHIVGEPPIWMPDSRTLIVSAHDAVIRADTVTGELDVSSHYVSGSNGILTATADRVLTSMQMRYGNVTNIAQIDGSEQHELPASLFPTHTGLALAPSW